LGGAVVRCRQQKAHMPEALQLTSREETARRLADTLRRQLGVSLCGLLQTPGVVELLLRLLSGSGVVDLSSRSMGHLV